MQHSSPGQFHPSYTEALWWQHHVVNMFFSRKGWEVMMAMTSDWGNGSASSTVIKLTAKTKQTLTTIQQWLVILVGQDDINNNLFSN